MGKQELLFLQKKKQKNSYLLEARREMGLSSTASDVSRKMDCFASLAMTKGSLAMTTGRWRRWEPMAVNESAISKSFLLLFFKKEVLAFFLVLLMALSLTACGRRGAPMPPGPAADVIYPHVYPSE
jgi:hypothetical protein